MNTSSNNNNKVNHDSEEEEEEEALKELDNIVNANRYYYYYVLNRIEMRKHAFNLLPSHHRSLVPDFDSNINKIKEIAKKNYEMLIRVIPPQSSEKVSRPVPASDSDMEKVKMSLQQIVRDWSVECASERNKTYDLIVKTLNKRFPEEASRSSLQVLVPGAGLCRLAFDIAKQGYQCQANEFSFSMLLIANFILNRNQGVNSHKIYPWLLNFSNNFNSQDQFQEYSVPDVDTSVRGGNLSMCAGDFLEIYTEYGTFEAVVTCFFLDTAKNVIEYIEHIYNLLKPNGIWINLGPLLYHHAEMDKEESLDLSFEQLKHVIKETGFDIENEQYPITVPYVENKKSMHFDLFNCVFFSANKRPPISNVTLSR